MVDAPICADPSGWPEIPHDSYWGRADLNFVMKSTFTVPDGWDTDAIALHLPLGALGDIFNHPEALVHIDTLPIGSADRYHHTIPLSPDLSDGRPHMLSLQGWTGLAGWPPDHSSPAKLFMGRSALVEVDRELRAFHDLAQVALDAATAQDPDGAEHRGLLAALDEAFLALDTRDPMGDALYASVPSAMAALKAGIGRAGKPDHGTLHAIGHAHMDIAYLWTTRQIRLKNARTYSNVLRLMSEDPEFRFSHSQPQLYAMVEEDYPQLFDQIKARVAEGRWELMGGMWVEPDLNMPGPEALVQQLVLGRRYFKDRFGDVETPVLWLPDTFGFPAQIPQLMRHAGLRWFVTNKLNWNQRNKVPWCTHTWEALDGSQVIAHILTTPRDVQYLPFPTNYKSDLTAAEVAGTFRDATIPGSITNLPICYGYGNGGGGPTRDLLAKAHAFEAMPGMPKVKMSSVRKTFEAIEAEAWNLDIWRGEHYMEGHRGVLTSQGWIKRANRRAERHLHEVEALSGMAGLRPDLQKAWELLCLNQFHDIITGTSIAQVFADAAVDYRMIKALIAPAREAALAALALNEPAVANTSPVSGPRVIERPDGSLSYFKYLPAYSVIPMNKSTAPARPVTVSATGAGAVLENEHLRVIIDGSGHLTEVYDKALGEVVLGNGQLGNVLQAFEDRPICWDAWDIDPFFEDRMEVIEGERTFDVADDRPERAGVRVTLRWRRSTVVQTISLSANSRRIDFATEVDWHETHTLLKAAFPTGIEARQAEFDIQWGYVERSNQFETTFDQARFEVPAHKWARLSDGRRSAAVLNDCKYGYDVRGQTIRITLIKSSTSPDPNADQGRHTFTYSYLPTVGAGREVLHHEAYALNTPVRILPAVTDARSVQPPFVTCNSDSVLIETVKPATDEDAVLLRVFQCGPQPVRTTLEINRTIAKAEAVNFMEEHVGDLLVNGREISLKLSGFELKTIRLRFVSPPK
ncbi:MAG: glycoside hydrolase family 38 C-terminal domain-containing protein [Pseudomonadota bacterium]